MTKHWPQIWGQTVLCCLNVSWLLLEIQFGTLTVLHSVMWFESQRLSKLFEQTEHVNKLVLSATERLAEWEVPSLMEGRSVWHHRAQPWHLTECTILCCGETRNHYLTCHNCKPLDCITSVQHLCWVNWRERCWKVVWSKVSPVGGRFCVRPSHSTFACHWMHHCAVWRKEKSQFDLLS